MRTLVAIVLALAFVPSASATESTIVPGVGIGKIKLGMTKAQVEKILGGEGIVDERGVVAGHAYLQLGWNFDSTSVGFLSQNGRYRVVLVGTFQASQRSPRGVGPSVRWLKVVRAYPHGLCSWRFDAPPYGLVYLVPHRGGTQMVFNFRNVPPNSATVVTFAVLEVVVRTRYQALPEFAPGYEHRCRDGWQTTARPQPIS
jgi:hypothetical protein